MKKQETTKLAMTAPATATQARIQQPTLPVAMQDHPTHPDPHVDSTLTLFQKILLATDGTVTELLSLFTGQSITARKIAATLDDDVPQMLHRTVILQGPDGTPYLHATSQFAFALFSADIQRDLIGTELPIGLLWRRERLEMYREIIGFTRAADASIANLLGVPGATLLLSRSYRIIHGGQELGTICETFSPTVLR
jgi:chorismate-pyruvate lyase